MAVVIETTIGDFTVDLFVDSRPQACKNFLKLCKMKYYNFCLFHSVQPNFLAQTGDPSGTGTGGESIYGLLYGENARFFEAEVMPKLKHNKPGLLSMVNCGNNMLGSQFFITLGEDLVSLDTEHCVFGEISEGTEVVLRLNEAICDTLHRPYKDIRITHTVILEDPFEDPSGLIVPDMSPEATQERLANGRIGADEEIDETAGMTAAQVEELKQEREAKARATILEIVGDLPDAEMAPPENVLFVCKLNPVTTDDDLEIIFSRFGKVKSCEIIRDKNTGDSLQYAFVEFDDQKSCEEAYFKMDNVLIDDRRIHVDFSQSVAKMRWRGKGRGVEYFDIKEHPKETKTSSHKDKEESKNRSSRRDRDHSSSRRDRDHEERDRRRERVRDREEDRGREKGRDRDGDDRYRRRDERDRSRSDYDRRKRDSKHRKDDHREDEKRYDSKRREQGESRKRDDEAKKVSSRKVDDKKLEEKLYDNNRVDERKRDKESKDTNGQNSNRQVDLQKSTNIEQFEIKEKERGRSSKYSSPVLNISKEETLSDSLNSSKELHPIHENTDKSASLSMLTEVPKEEMNHVSRRISKDDKNPEEEVKKSEIEIDDDLEDKLSQKSDRRMDDVKKSEDKKKTLKRKRKVSESRKRKKRHHSSSSESSSESSDSSDSSSSSDSSDARHGKKKKLIVAKRYYKGGKLVKEIKKKKRTKDTSDSDSLSEESSDSDPKRRRKSKKRKKIINIFKQPRRKTVHSSDDSQSESSSSEDSDVKNKKRKRKIIDKHSKKKSKHPSSKKRKKRKDETSSSSDSEDSRHSKSITKKQKKSTKNLKHNSSIVTNTSE